MRDLSREEKLEQQILKMADEYGERKWKRVKRTFFVLGAVVYFIIFMSGGMNCAQDYLLWILAAPISAGFVMFISYGVLFYIIDGSLKEEKAIAKKIGELEAVKFGKNEAKEIERKLNEYKELVHGLKRMGDIAETIIDIYRDFECHEDYENDDEENESLKYQLEDIKNWLKLLEMEHKLYRVKEIFDEDEKWNKE